VIEAAGLASGYGGRIVWSGAGFTVGPGEFLTVLGPNGAGKSTLLRMLLGLLPPAAGELLVFGDPPRRGHPSIGYVPQRRTLDPELTIGAADLVALGVAQALVARPRLLLLDEPLASLDLRSQHAVSTLVASLHDDLGFAVVLVTHDVNPVLSFTDRVMYIAGGGVSVGTPDEVITSENLSRLYDTEVEVLTDSRGRVFVAGLEAETAHPHSPGGNHH
jgi:zinc/manganese transport system ATP-binding protein